MERVLDMVNRAVPLFTMANNKIKESFKKKNLLIYILEDVEMLISPEEGCAVLRNSGNASTSLSAGMRSIHSNTRKLKILNINITLLGKHLRKEACTEPGMRLV